MYTKQQRESVRNLIPCVYKVHLHLKLRCVVVQRGACRHLIDLCTRAQHRAPGIVSLEHTEHMICVVDLICT